ncbi:HlyD family secretion protein [Pseudomonas sp. N040]|uniref:HlyD family secretion protein n=1 Tax=Pseudomonas sp. N040 TaxID=2785325 RepID=UPI0018A2944B|nr:HlyD family efflux transporter periplasmic adaptor subunit [Pseudomonas sp. N040]MBF7729651.1 HlyD family efflux transporter periplasmic adaptor subunit [Pseudomonas sp. N040]MBW7013293.1 HlyD family efflux transporter periplasmic adaptor subunit [Pseudomonas sp. N040]
MLIERTGTPATLLLLALLGGCGAGEPPPLLGTLEWDRIGIPAEASETVLNWQVAEGAQVEAGQLLLQLDPRRLDALVAQAAAEVQQAGARLDELSHGARRETIEAAQAALERNSAAAIAASRDFQRIEALYQRQQVALAELDRARASRDQSVAAVQNSAAQLRELTNGTRPEQLAQAAASLQAANSRLTQLQLNRAHLDVRAPRAGRVDALPFRPGDQPPLHAEVVSLLVGAAPYARLFVPASQRNRLAIGDTLRVTVEGVAQPFTGKLRSIASEASFTPYYALTGADASRLVYRAELVLEGAEAAKLPAGLPLQAVLAQP